MNKQQLLELIDSLDLPKDEYYILSSGSLVIFGLRKEANDLDLCVSNELFEILKEKYDLNETKKSVHDFYKVTDDIEIIPNDKKDFKMEFKDGYPVEILSSILEFKKKRNLKKDINDILAIQEFIKNIENK